MQNNENMKYNRYSLMVQLSFFCALYKWKCIEGTRLIHYIPEPLKELYKSQNQDVLNGVKKYVKKSLITQYFVYLYELVDGNFDESLKKSKDDFSKIKFNIDSNGNLKTINASKLLDIIRQSFVHNDDGIMVPNWKWDNNYNILMHMNLKKNSIDLKININDLVSLANIYRDNLLNNPREAVSMYPRKLHNAIKEKRVNVNSIHKYVGSFDLKTKTDIPLDKHQKRALYNYFIQISKGLNDQIVKMGVHPYSPESLSTKYPFKCNANNALKDCRNTIKLLYLLKNANLTRKEYVEKVYEYETKKNSEVDIIETRDYLGDGGRFEACIANNLLFTIFSHINISRIKSALGEKNNIDLNKLRNSIMHGRFYFNYENGFNFYDGIIGSKTDDKTVKEIEKNIEYIGTLTLDEIYNMTRNLIEDYMESNYKDDLDKKRQSKK